MAWRYPWIFFTSFSWELQKYKITSWGDDDDDEDADADENKDEDKNTTKILQTNLNLDGVGPVDNRRSTDKLHQFVQKKERKNMTCDMGHMTCET